MTLQQKAEALADRTFLGGPVAKFELVGRHQLMTLLKAGLYPNSKLVDIGCGCLRAGYWIIHFLDPGCYFGIEPNREMLQVGVEQLLEPPMLEAKQPRFDHNGEFNSSVFGVKFNFFLARSIWTHTSKAQIQAMLDSFCRDAAEGGVFLTSYLRAGLRHRDYRGASWVGRSDSSNRPGFVYHSFSWIREECRERDLIVTEFEKDQFDAGQPQTWLRISRAGSRVP